MAATIYDIAERCHCSTTTVSKVLNNQGNISKEKRELILKTAEELGYVRSSFARSLASTNKSNHLIGVLLHINDNKSITHELFSKILNSFRIRIEKEDYDICFLRNLKEESAYSYKDFIKARGIDGVFILSAQLENKKVSDLLNSNVPVVTFDIPGSEYGVSSNNKESITELVDYLVSMGHRRICFVAASDKGVGAQRYQGFLEGIKKNGIEFDPRMVVYSSFYSEGSAKRATDQALMQAVNPSVIMYPDDYTAISAIHYLNSLGYIVPEDMSVTGFDGIEAGNVMKPNITTIRQDTDALGTSAAELLMDIINGKEIKNKKIIVNSSIIKGESIKHKR